MLIIQQKTRRDFLRLGANSFLSAAALATLPALAAGATQFRDGRMQTDRGERGRFKSIDEALAQGVSNGTLAGVVALAADSRGVISRGCLRQAGSDRHHRHDAGHRLLAAVDDEGHHCDGLHAGSWSKASWASTSR